MMRAQPFAMAALGLSVVLAVIAALCLVAQIQRADAARDRLAALQAKAPPMQEARSSVPDTSLAALDLPAFESAQLVKVLNETATDSGLVLDEVSYSLEDNTNQPFLRYRVTMSLNAAYPLIRRLTEQLNANVPHLTLDAINCSRKDVVVAELNCDVIMSGFFQKGARG